MTGDVLDTARRRIRVLNGPLRGATHPVRDRLGIGRASSSDIQLVHDGISRQHAQIVTDERGHHVLVDLDSSNGTFIEGQRIRRQLLTAGTIFKIMRVKMIYEYAIDEPVDVEQSDVFAVRRLDAETLRGTADYGELDLPQPATPRERLAAETSPAPQAASEPESEPDHPVPRSSMRTSSAPAAQARGEERHRVVATRHDGTPYAGSLVDDIVDYRELRVRIDRGDPVQASERQAYERLGRSLRAEVTEPSAAAPGERQRVHRPLARHGDHDRGGRHDHHRQPPGGHRDEGADDGYCRRRHGDHDRGQCRHGGGEEEQRQRVDGRGPDAVSRSRGGIGPGSRGERAGHDDREQRPDGRHRDGRQQVTKVSSHRADATERGCP